MTIDFYNLIYKKVRLKSKQDELISIFENEYPGHYQKLYFCGFLHGALSVSDSDLLDITSNQSAWLKKDHRMHYSQIHSVIRSIQQRNNFSKISISKDFLTDFGNFEKTITSKGVKKKTENEIEFKRPLCTFIFTNCNNCTTNDNDGCYWIHSHPKNNLVNKI